MRGLVLAGVRHVEHRTDLADPAVRAPGDAVLRVRLAGLCGSDLHPYAGRERARFGVVPGHEVVGEVVASGEAVARVRPGDRVLVPFTTSCGDCPPCRRGLSARCERGELFGYGPPDAPDAPALEGGQAEFVRVPLADTTLVHVPPGMGDAEALLLADNFPTGWYAARRAGLGVGTGTAGPAVVVGLGAVGLCAVAAALALGAEVVLGVDPVAERRARAVGLGAVACAPEAARDRLAELAPEGAASVIEAAGTGAAQRLASELVRPGGTLSLISVQTADGFAFGPVQAYDSNLTVRAGRAPVRSLLGDCGDGGLLDRVAGGGLTLPVAAVLSHPHVPLAEGPATYRRFADREIVKAAFVP